MRVHSDTVLARYAVAVVSVVGALGIRLLLDPLLEDLFPFATFFLAVLFSAWYGGFGPALAATLLGAAFLARFLLPPRNHFVIHGAEHQFGLAFYAVIGLGIAAFGGAMRSARRRAEVEAAAFAHQRDELRTTLASIGDGVIVTDTRGQVVSLNPVAEQLTGWTTAEAAGQLLDEVLPLLNEQSRQKVENPVARVLREGNIVGLANHTFLVSRDGTERPIDDSAAPIRNLQGQLVGVVLVFRDVSDRRRAELATRHLAAIVEFSDDAIISKDLDGIITSWNSGAERIYGYAAAEILGKPFSQLIPAERSDEVFEFVQRLRRGERLNHFETVRKRKDGQLIDVSLSYSPIRDSEGHLIATAVITRDISDRKRAEQSLRESEERFARFMQHLPGLAWIKDVQGRYIFVNDTARKVFAGGQDVLGKCDEAIFPPQTAAQFRENDRQALLSGKGVQVIETLKHPDGSLHYSLVSKFPIPGTDGRPALVGGMAIDITDRRQAEQTLRESEERLRLALEAGHMGVWDWNLTTREIKWSENLEPIHGLAPGTFAGTFEAFQNLIHSQDRELVQQAIARALTERSRYDIEFRNVWPDGSVHWMTGKGKVFTDESGHPQRMIGVGMDITARKRAEQDTRFLADASAVLAALVDDQSTLQKLARLAVPAFADWCAVDMLEDNGQLRRVAVAHVDPAKVELAHEVHRRFPPDPAADQGVWKVLRMGQSELVPHIHDDLLVARVQDPDLLRILRELGLRSYMGIPLSVRGRVLGAITFIAAESGRRYDASDLAVAEDLAHRAAVAIENARLYQEVREADRRKDEFLAVLAHELRNPLAPIRNALEILELSGITTGVPGQARAMAQRQVHHLTRLVDDLLDVSRIMRGKITLRPGRVELATVVDRAVETTRPSIDAEGHELIVTVAEEPIWLEADLVRLAQVVANLLNNAARYTEPGGKIWLTARQEGQEVVIRVRDTGIGIAPEVVPRIFDMFMQANTAGSRSQGGLGIGLTLVRNLVRMHGGAVEAHSPGLGKGSEFVVRLPLPASVEKGCEPGRGAGHAPDAASSARTRTRILVVDDNVDAAESLAMILRLKGHDVRVAYDGPRALELARADPPQTALLDLGMPAMSGYELARRFREDPRLCQVLLVALTGWGQPEDRHRAREAGFDHHLVKPVEPETLHQLLVERLGGVSGTPEDDRVQ